MSQPLFERVAIIGFGLIGSSLGRAIRAHNLARTLVACDASDKALATIARLDLADFATPDPAESVKDADLVVIAVPLGAYADVARQIAPVLKPGATVTDVGSVKGTVVRDLSPLLPQNVHLVPGHPVAGTENSGPESGFETLFEGRWCILTPPPGTDEAAVSKVAAMWRACGSMVETMDAA